MNRELALLLEAQSQFTCFDGRTRSSRTRPIQFTNTKKKQELPSSDQPEQTIVDVHEGRRSKRFKTGTRDGDSLNIDESEGEGESVAVEVASGEEEGKGVEDDLNLRSVKSEKEVNFNVPRRFTRSALKENENNVEELGTPTRKKLELKMSKKIGLNKLPTNIRELLETGLLEGFRVFYNLSDKGTNLQGVIKGVGILCSCTRCKGSEVIPPSQFEMHARKSYRHAIKHICLENGRSLLEVMEVCKASALETLEVAVQNVTSSLSMKGPSICTKCKGSFESSIMHPLICDSCINPEQVQAGQNVASNEKDRISSLPKAFASPNLSFSQKKSQQKIKRKSDPKSPESTSAHNLSQDEIKGRLRKRSSESASVPKSTQEVTNYSLQKNSRSKLTKKSSESASVPKSTKEVTNYSLQKSSRSKLTKKDQGLHWLIFEDGGLPDGSELTYFNHGKKLLEGYKLGRGIFCFCCNTEVSASQFEAHAGWASRKKPYGNIYLSNGVSLHEYAVSLKLNRKCPLKYNDDLCLICGDGGDLLLCDGCPRSFHQECVSEPSIPSGKWYCKYCQNSLKIVAENENAVAAGRVTGIDPIEQITQRCIRIVKKPENIELVACVLCRGFDFSKRAFNDRTVIVCDQCEKEFHIGCLREHNMADLKALPKGNWFCCMDCGRIHSILKNSLTCEPEKLPDTLMALIREKQNNTGLDMANFDVRWMLISAKNASRESRLQLTKAVDIFHECFDPIIDASTGRDFIPSMVYGRKIWGHDFAGMHCAVLIINSIVVTAGILRVFGQEIAELPLVATSKCDQGKGYFQVLFMCIERLLSALNIKKIVLPAAEEAMSIWTKKFGFEKISPEQLTDYRQMCTSMLTFQGTSMLQKDVPQSQITIPNDGIFKLSME